MLKQLFTQTAIVVLLAAGFARAEGAAALEMRGEAAILGDAVHLKQIARWSQTDQAFFEELGEMTVTRFEPGQHELTVNLDAVRTMLEGAGVNEGQISLRGPLSVKVRRLDADAPYAKKPRTEEPKTLDAFLAQPPATRPAAAPKPLDPIDAVLPAATAPAQTVTTIPDLEQQAAGYSLRLALSQYLADRINLPVEDLEISYPASFEKVLGLTGPAYSWRITTFRSAHLGSVTFRVTLMNGASTRQIEISGMARAWQKQLRVAQPVLAGSILREADVEYKRVLIDAAPEQMPVRREFALTMQAKRDLRQGELLTVSVLNPVVLVKKNQYMTVIARVGTIEMKSVGISKDDGAYGTPVHVELLVEGREKREVIATVSGPNEGRAGVPDMNAVASADSAARQFRAN